MKFSVLLPTRNRLEYLRFAVATVQQQNYSNWEIIISDNFSEDDIAGYVESLQEPRIHYVKTAAFVPVTENWNNALRFATGDYVVMLGDDDGLLPNYFSRMIKAFESFPNPDLVYTSAYFYSYPGVMPDSPAGFLRRDKNNFFTRAVPYWLNHEVGKEIARGYLDFKMPIASNMQFSLISVKKIKELASLDDFFQSPYPDFYATPALFLKSDRILIYPDPMVIIGITPKSYGYYHFNNRANEGLHFLNNSSQVKSEEFSQLRLPGTSYNDSWLMAMEALTRFHSGSIGLIPNYKRYRMLQILHCYKKCYFDKVIKSVELNDLRVRMSYSEKILYDYPLRVGFSLLRLLPLDIRKHIVTLLRKLVGQHVIKHGDESRDSPLNNLLDVFYLMQNSVSDKCITSAKVQ